MLHVACYDSGNALSKDRFCGLQMVQFECPRVIHPLLSLTFGGKGASWKSGNPFCKNRFCELQSVQFECPWVIHPGVIHFLDALFTTELCKMIKRNRSESRVTAPSGHRHTLRCVEPIAYNFTLVSTCKKRERLHVACYKGGNSFSENRFCGLQIVQFECPRFIHPLVSLIFWIHCGVPFSLYAGKGKCCMWPSDGHTKSEFRMLRIPICPKEFSEVISIVIS